MSMNNKDGQKKVTALDQLLAKIKPGEQAVMDDRMTIAANIDELLKQNGWSKKLFAEKLGKEPSVITRWLSGTHNFTTETLSEIRMILGVSLVDLVRECQPPVMLMPNNELVQSGSTFDVAFYKTSLRLSEAKDTTTPPDAGAFQVMTNIRSPWTNIAPGVSAQGPRKNRGNKPRRKQNEQK